MKYISLIETFYPSFSKQEKKVADYIKAEKENISVMSLQEITKKISVSEATIVRFVRKIGFKGFIDFKIFIAKDSFQYLNENNSIDYIENISINILNTINATKNLIDKKNVNDIVRLIDKCQNMYIFGLGASGVAAIEMQNRFMRYGKVGYYSSDSHFQTMYASITTNKDVVVVISLSGETPELLYPLSIAKKNGVKIIAITNYILSPVAKLADKILLTAGRETPLDGGSLISKISQLYIIDILATGYALLNKNKAMNIKNEMAVAIANKNKQ